MHTWINANLRRLKKRIMNLINLLIHFSIKILLFVVSFYDLL